MIQDNPALPSSQHDRPGSGGHRPRRVPGLCHLTGAVMAVAVAVTLAACSSGSGPGAHSGGHASGSPSPAAAMPTGARLGQLLAGVKLPANWSFAQGSGNGQFNSGTMIVSPSGPAPSQDSCTTVNSSVTSMGIIQWWASSYDSLALTYPNSTENEYQLNVTAGLYKPGYAAKTMSFVSALIGRCRSFKDKNLHDAPVTTSVATVPHLGQQNLFLTSQESTSNGPITTRVILVQVGNDIVGADSDNALDGNVPPATLQGFADWMLQALQAKSLA
jgi:hypothetical protein